MGLLVSGALYCKELFYLRTETKKEDKMFVRVSKEARVRVISFLESEGFQCVNNHVYNRQKII